MERYLIGAGGWAYFQTPGVHSLISYSWVFNFVEVNSTFYELPSLSQAGRWRRLVPEDFEFAVRAHRSVTQTHRLQPSGEIPRILGGLKDICEILRAEILHFQMPPTLKIDQAAIGNLRRVIASSDLGEIRVAMEFRGSNTDLPVELIRTMEEYDIIHCVDLLKGEVPAVRSDVLYSRLFGKARYNIYQPTDEELGEIDNTAVGGKFRKVMLSFHGLRMYKDAARLKSYRQTGEFPKITRFTGLESLEEVLMEDARFPATKQDLLDHQGWKLFDLTEEKRIRAGAVLQKLPKEEYSSISDLIKDLCQIME